MTIKTDLHAVDHHGTRDFVLQCHKRPFAMTVSPHLPTPSQTFIDEELVEFLSIPIKKIEARRFSFAGIETRIVGHISQTVQCVVNGKVCGTTHLKAAVVRHLTDLYNLDCIAGGKTFKQLLSSDDLTNKSKVYTCTSDETAKEVSDDEESVRSTPPSTPRSTLPAATTPRPCAATAPRLCAATTPRPRSATTPRPPAATTPRPPAATTLSSPSTTELHEAWGYQGGKDDRFDTRADCPVDKRWQLSEEEEIWTLPYNRSGPVVKPATPDHTVSYIQLGNEDALTAFSSPKKTEPTPNISTSRLCGDCGNPAYVCQGTRTQAPYYQSTGFSQHISSVDDPPYVMGHSGPPLPPGFSPCSSYCAYEDCDCVRRYAGRDWAS